jgi:hypothetical protein
LALHQEEGRDRQSGEGESAGYEPDRYAVAAEPDQDREAKEREDELRSGLHGHVDDDARARERPIEPPERREPRSDEIAPDLGDGQHLVDGFTDPTH